MGNQLDLFPTDPTRKTAERLDGRYLVAVEELYLTKEEAVKDDLEIDLTHSYDGQGNYFFTDGWYVVYDRGDSDDFSVFMDSEVFTGNIGELVDELAKGKYWQDGFAFASGTIGENIADDEHIYSQIGLTQKELTEIRLHLQTQ